MLGLLIALLQVPAPASAPVSGPVQAVGPALRPISAPSKIQLGTPFVLRAGSQMPALRGQWVEFTGKAVNAKLAAFVEGADFGILIMSKRAWGDELGKQVRVIGRLEQTDAFKAFTTEDGLVSQGTAGGDWLVRDAVVTTL